MKIEVYGVFEGAFEPDGVYDSDEAAQTNALALAADYKLSHPDAEWEVFVLPHYCGDGDEDECWCAQSLTDHRPRYSSSVTSATLAAHLWGHDPLSA